MFRSCSNRRKWIQAVCLLTIAFVFAMGIVQAAHSHQEDSSVSHHVCSICSTAHAGLGTEIVFAPPVLTRSPLAAPSREFLSGSCNQEVHFIRPPPAL